jgi:RNA polymerase sigma-70 factor (ECF subfamily)
MTPDEEKILVEKAKQGSSDAFIQLADHHKDKVAVISFVVIGNRAEAEEITQDAFLRAYTNINSLKIEIPFGLWVGKIAKNLAIDRLRRRRRIPDPPNDWSSGDNLTEIVLDVRKEIMELPLDLRLPLTLLYFDSHTIEEIAKIMRIPVGTVKSRIFRAKEIIKRRLS